MSSTHETAAPGASGRHETAPADGSGGHETAPAGASGGHETAPAGAFGRMALVMNAKAGALLATGDGGTTLEDMLKSAAGTLDVIAETAGTLPERVAAAQATGADCVVVAGGDGTVACAAQALSGSGTTLGLIPCGTMNLLARDLGLDPDDHAACTRVLAHGRPRRIDLGEVEDGEGARHVFLCASMLGTPATLSRHREAGRERGNGLLAWAGFGRAALRALWRNHHVRLELRYDGRVRRVRTPSLTIVVNALDDQSGRLFGRSSLDGGQLALYLVHRGSTLAQAWLLLRTALTGSLHAPTIEVILTQRVEIDSRHAALHVLVDGELRLLKPSLSYGVQPGALRVMAPI